jgi:hypothetical protein
MSDIQEKLEHILDRLAVRMYDEGQLDKPSLMGRQVAITNINEAKAQIMHLIDSAKREGAIEEMKMTPAKSRVYGTSWYGILKPAAHAHNRLIMLEQSEESI